MGNGEPVAATPCEILPSREFYDYDDKYLLDTARVDLPAKLTPEQTAEMRRLAAACYEAVGCEVMARVADLGSFRIEATVSDVHSTRLASGQPARITLGADKLTGSVASVNPTIENGVLRFTVNLDRPHDERLRNNLRVDVAVVTGHAADVLRVRRGGFVDDGGESVFVVRGNRAVRQARRKP